jgi:MarR family transcriptional regulator, lower aerobic nicotinate degradation pathway regulator
MATGRPDQIAEIENLFLQLTWRGRQHFNRRVERVGLTVPQYHVLAKINSLGPDATMTAVCEPLGLPRSSMTSITDRLVELGFVQRGTIAGDRRAVSATITPAGIDLIRTVEAERTAELTAMLDGLTGDDLVEFARLLSRLVEGMARVAPDDG